MFALGLGGECSGTEKYTAAIGIHIEMTKWKWGQTFAYCSSDISLVPLPFQVAFSEDKCTVLGSGLQSISAQSNVKEMVIFWSLYSGLAFIIYLCPTENSLPC